MHYTQRAHTTHNAPTLHTHCTTEANTILLEVGTVAQVNARSSVSFVDTVAGTRAEAAEPSRLSAELKYDDASAGEAAYLRGGLG